MAALVITAANVAVGASSTKTRNVQAGEAITQGQCVYLNTDGKHYRADNNATASAAKAVGIALTPAATNGYFLMSVPSDTNATSLINLGATLTVGQVYCVGSTAGEIEPISDLVSGEYVCILGVANSTSLLDHQIMYSAVPKA